MKKPVFVLGLVGLTCGGPAATDQMIDPNNPLPPSADGSLALKNGSRLRNKRIVASDGTVALGAGLFDTQRSEDCSFSLADDGKMRCLPTYPNLATVSTYYDHPTCSGRPLALSSTCEPAKKYVIQYAPNCGSSATAGSIASVTEITPPATLYSLSGTTCTAMTNTLFTAATGYRIYSIGAVVSAARFVDGTATTQ